MLVEIKDGLFLNTDYLYTVEIRGTDKNGYRIDLTMVHPENIPCEYTVFDFKTKEDAINWLKERGLL